MDHTTFIFNLRRGALVYHITPILTYIFNFRADLPSKISQVKNARPDSKLIKNNFFLQISHFYTQMIDLGWRAQFQKKTLWPEKSILSHSESFLVKSEESKPPLKW